MDCGLCAARKNGLSRLYLYIVAELRCAGLSTFPSSRRTSKQPTFTRRAMRETGSHLLDWNGEDRRVCDGGIWPGVAGAS